MIRAETESRPARRRSKVLVLAFMLAGAIAMSVSVLAATTKPAEAAFPKANGKIAFTSTRSGNYEVYAMDPDGTNQTNLTDNAATDTDPDWQPVKKCKGKKK